MHIILTIVKFRHNSGSWIGQYLKGFLSNIVHQKPLTREDVNWYKNQQYIDSENITLYVFGIVLQGFPLNIKHEGRSKSL